MTPEDRKRRTLKMELDPQADNLLEQLVAAVARIERGLEGIHELVVAIDKGILEVTRGRE